MIKSDLNGKIPIGVFTKYPDDPNEGDDDAAEIDELPLDETRFKRHAQQNETDPSIDVSKQSDKSDDTKRSERKTEDEVKVPLRGLISAIESDLLSTAFQVNSNLRRRRSAAKADETRFRQSAQNNEPDSSIDVNKQANESDDTKRSERKTEDQAKVPLHGLIAAIESDLVSTASQVNSNLRSRRSIAQTDGNYNTENASTSDGTVDVNKNFFEGLFSYTRPLRETEEKNVRIPLDGLIHAVETTLINSAQNLKDTQHLKRDVSEKIPIDVQDSDKDTIKVQKLTSSNSIQSLNLLNPITFKPVPTEPVTEHLTCDNEETISTTELPPIQKTKYNQIESSSSVNLVPDTDNKLAHVQHQQISKTVFFSSLAIFPTIQPKSINVPLPQITTTEEPAETTVAIQASTITAPSKSQQDAKHEQLLQKAEKLKEKFAEIQADPVILSQIP